MKMTMTPMKELLKEAMHNRALFCTLSRIERAESDTPPWLRENPKLKH